jgi:hypothetical protein
MVYFGRFRVQQTRSYRRNYVTGNISCTVMPPSETTYSCNWGRLRRQAKLQLSVHMDGRRSHTHDVEDVTFDNRMNYMTLATMRSWNHMWHCLSGMTSCTTLGLSCGFHLVMRDMNNNGPLHLLSSNTNNSYDTGGFSVLAERLR